jgi:hypothetical protein
MTRTLGNGGKQQWTAPIAASGRPEIFRNSTKKTICPSGVRGFVSCHFTFTEPRKSVQRDRGAGRVGRLRSWAMPLKCHEFSPGTLTLNRRF